MSEEVLRIIIFVAPISYISCLFILEDMLKEDIGKFLFGFIGLCLYYTTHII